MVTMDDMFNDAANKAAENGTVGTAAPNDPYNNQYNHPTTYAGYDDQLWTNVRRPSSFLYGGYRGGDKDEERRYLRLGEAADARQAPTINNANYDQDRAYDLVARSNQSYGMNQYKNMIEGRGPSVAEQQMGLGLLQARQQNANALQASQAAAASQAATARGGGANLAAAQRQAAMTQGGLAAQANQNAAQLGQQAAYQGGMLRAQEQQQAMAGYGGLATNQRGQDQARAQVAADQAYRQAQLQQQQYGINDARNLAYEQMRQKTFEDQMQAQMAGEAANSGAGFARWQQQSQDKANQNSSWWGFGGLGNL